MHRIQYANCPSCGKPLQKESYGSANFPNICAYWNCLNCGKKYAEVPGEYRSYFASGPGYTPPKINIDFSGDAAEAMRQMQEQVKKASERMREQFRSEYAGTWSSKDSDSYEDIRKAQERRRQGRTTLNCPLCGSTGVHYRHCPSINVQVCVKCGSEYVPLIGGGYKCSTCNYSYQTFQGPEPKNPNSYDPSKERGEYDDIDGSCQPVNENLPVRRG